ncbi:MAG: hypothetical protein NT063_00800 [Candidatus Methylopumilus sp.]|nr:hypothetical protein [Candidatus Methylopumilus sp.]
MDTDYKKRILKELELFPLWKEKNKLSSELHLKPVEADSFFAFKINYTEGSLLLLSQNFALGTEEVAQDLFLNIAKFISTTIGINTFQKSHLLILTKDQLSELCLNTLPKHVLAFGLNNDLFEEYKTNILMNNVTMNIKHTFDINHLLQNPKDKKLVWENILDLIKAF